MSVRNIAGWATALVWLSSMTPQAVWADDKAVDCWATDADRDGYAPNSVLPVAVSPANDLHCSLGYPEKKGDCNDNNPNVHPRAVEQPNGIDDDCDNKIDEPVPLHYVAGNNNTTSSFVVTLLMKDRLFIDWPIAPGAEVRITDLRNSGTFTTQINNNTVTKSGAFVSVPVTGLFPTRVYKVSVRLYVCFFSCSYTPWSDDYYTTTTGISPKSLARTGVVLRALAQMGDSELQMVGYRGALAVDGTRYGASYGEMWCSEFYSWSTGAHLDWDGSPPDDIDGILDVYADHGGRRPASDVPVWADRGDYVAFDFNGGGKHHSAMVLAWDPGMNTLWTVEGNTGNEVGVRDRRLVNVKGFGHITDSMLR